ncbi:trigger factor-like [Anopheles coustani]|uniref:trigger factor-like n=1 Tax=Anopheles coustani TaxID=139045 RepID=UPI002659D728|nr:trigger factor-like [Anopheles coustani]
MVTRQSSKEPDVWAVINDLKSKVEKSLVETQGLKWQLEEKRKEVAQKLAQLQEQIGAARDKSATPEEPLEKKVTKMTETLKEVVHERPKDPALSLPEFNGDSPGENIVCSGIGGFGSFVDDVNGDDDDVGGSADPRSADDGDDSDVDIDEDDDVDDDVDEDEDDDLDGDVDK